MGKIIKSMLLHAPAAEDRWPSKQLLEDPFLSVRGYGQLIIEPPFPFEQLSALVDQHPAHAASIQQKVSDIVASGAKFVPPKKDDKIDPDKVEALEYWWNGLTEEYTSLEILNAMWDDYETLGWGILEIARDVSGKVRQIYHVPAQSVRAHLNGNLFVQIVQGKMVWFKKWGVNYDIHMDSGRRGRTKEIPHEKKANELLIFRQPTRRSSWYGVPSYLSAIGYITMSAEARDHNIKLFSAGREPRHFIIVSGLDGEDPAQVSDEIQKTLAEQLANPRQNVFLPIEGQANVQVVKMAFDQAEGEFVQLSDAATKYILMAHRMPSDRLGLSTRGSLGGSVTNEMNTIYKDGVVARGQDLLEDRLTKFIQAEYYISTGERTEYVVDFQELDFTDQYADSDRAIALHNGQLLNKNEARAIIKYDEVAGGEAFAETPAEDPTGLLGTDPPALPGQETKSLMEGRRRRPGFVRRQPDFTQRIDQMDTILQELVNGKSG